MNIRFIKTIFTLIILLGGMMSVESDAAVLNVKDAYCTTTYVIDPTAKTAQINSIKVLAGVSEIPNYTIPATVNYSGVNYPVTFIALKATYIYDDAATFDNVKNEYFTGTLTIGPNVTGIDAAAFSGCYNLTKIVFPENSKIERIGYRAFANCTGLESIVFGDEDADNEKFPTSLTEVWPGAFSKCSNLRLPELNPTLEGLYEGCFYNVKVGEEVVIPSSVTYFGPQIFGETVVPRLIFEDGGATIDWNGSYTDQIYYPYTQLRANYVYIGRNIVNAYKFSPWSDNYVKQVEFGPKVTTVPDYFFKFCSSLQEVTFNEGLTLIGQQSFYNCTALETISLPSTLKNIKEGAFYQCNAPVVECKAGFPPYTYGLTNIFYNYYKTSTLYVPEKSVSYYQEISPWSLFYDIQPLRIKPQDISLDKTKAEVNVGESIAITATVLPAEADDKSVTWVSSNPDVASVTQDGVVTGHQSGTVTIRAYLTQYPEIEATCEVEVIYVLLGDSNDSGEVTVADVVTTSRYIVSLPIASWNFVNADVTKDKTITVADVTATANLILDDFQPVAARLSKRAYAPRLLSDRLVSDNFVSGEEAARIDVKLENSVRYSAMQASLMLPEGMKVKDIVGGSRLADHILMYNQPTEGLVKVVIFSLTNTEFAENNEVLFTIMANTSNATGDLQMVDIYCSDARTNEYELGFEGGRNNSVTTGVETLSPTDVTVRAVADGIEVINATGQPVSVIRYTGETMASTPEASTYEKFNVASGIYIVRVGTLADKVIVR